MKKLVVSLGVFLIAISFAIAQTKMIAHRSHSGDDASLTFNTEDNFGIPSSIPIFVVDTATKERMWITVPYEDADDAAWLLHHGYRATEPDSAHRIPVYNHNLRLRRSTFDLSILPLRILSSDTSSLHLDSASNH